MSTCRIEIEADHASQTVTISLRTHCGRPHERVQRIEFTLNAARDVAADIKGAVEFLEKPPPARYKTAIAGMRGN